MMKNKSWGYSILAILFLLLSVIVFVIPTVKTGTFWIAYVFTAVAFGVQVHIINIALGKKKTLKSKFLGIPMIHVSIVYLILQVIVFAIFVVVPILPVWSVTVVCASILGIATVCMISVEIGTGEINRVDEKVQKKVFYIKSLQADVELLADAATDNEVTDKLMELAEQIRFSNPMSHESLAELESAIAEKVEELRVAPNKNTIKEIASLLSERNKKCKLLK